MAPSLTITTILYTVESPSLPMALFATLPSILWIQTTSAGATVYLRVLTGSCVSPISFPSSCQKFVYFPPCSSPLASPSTQNTQVSETKEFSGRGYRTPFDSKNVLRVTLSKNGMFALVRQQSYKVMLQSHLQESRL